jgi:hypothetical protein
MKPKFNFHTYYHAIVLLIVTIELLFIAASSVLEQNLLSNNVLVTFYLKKASIFYQSIRIWFLLFYVLDLIAEWILYIRTNKGKAWYYFAIDRWYDILGSLPVLSMRWLRLGRIYMILENEKKSNITENPLFRTDKDYLTYLEKELSAKIMLNALNIIQKEISQGIPLIDKLQEEIIEPQREKLIELTREQLSAIVNQLIKNFDQQFKHYVDEKVKIAVQNSQEMKNLSKIPMVGNPLKDSMQKIISEIVHQLIIEVFEDLQKKEHSSRINEIISGFYDSFISQKSLLNNDLITQSVNHSIEIIKTHIQADYAQKKHQNKANE